MHPIVPIVLTAVLAADLFWWLRADRRARRWPYAPGWRLLVGLFMGGQIAMIFWTIGARFDAVPALGRPPQALSAAAYLWHLLILPVGWILVTATGLLVRTWQWRRLLVGRVTHNRPPEHEPRPTPQHPAAPVPDAGAEPAPTRRQFQTMLATAAPALLTCGAAGYSRTQLREFRVRPLDVPVPGLPPELDGVRIAVVSDLHVGTFTRASTVRSVVEETSRLDADLVLLPGDLIDFALADLSDALDTVCNIQSRHGSYLCVGNHDLMENGAEFVRRVRARAPLLVGDSRLVSVRGRGVQLLGLPWDRDEVRMAAAVRRLAEQVQPGALPILLAHHPHAFDAAAAAGIPLTVSGHTHGGQLMLGPVGFGPMMFRYWSGLYRKPGPDGASLVVSNGAGNWFPLRVGAPAEIVHLTLRSGSQPGATAARRKN